MSACDKNDPTPCKTLAELEAEETARDKLDEANDSTAGTIFRWSALVVAVAVIAGGIIRACW